jgi:hypothetical protein
MNGRQAGRSLDVDDAAGLASLAVAERELASVAASEQSTCCVTFSVARVLNEKLALEQEE